MKLLVTSSLLDSFSWFMEAPPSWKDRAKTDLWNAVNRVYTPMDEAVRRGMDFEAYVCAVLDDSREVFVARHGELLGPFWDHCHGGKRQVPVRREITVNSQDFTLYGKADVLFPDRIVDIKTTGSWKGAAKYLSRAQHLVYIAATGTEKFLYLVAVGAPDGKHSWVPSEVVEVDASMKVEHALSSLERKIGQWMDFLSTEPELKVSYEKTFSKNS